MTQFSDLFLSIISTSMNAIYIIIVDVASEVYIVSMFVIFNI
jgi:hypothetical protein